jgi:hypothetical protein
MHARYVAWCPAQSKRAKVCTIKRRQREHPKRMTCFSCRVHYNQYMIYVSKFETGGLSEASDLMEALGDTLIAAHIATPLAMVEERLQSQDDVAKQDRPLHE